MQTANNPALAAMKDIQLPEPIHAWPPAYGYWLVLAACLTILAVCLWWFIKQYRHRAAKREALKQLAHLALNHPQFAIEVNTILKRSAMSYLPREQVASLEGEAWLLWLQQQVTHIDDNLPLLLAKRYQSKALTPTQAEQLRLAAIGWLKQALPLKHRASTKEAACSH